MRNDIKEVYVEKELSSSHKLFMKKSKEDRKRIFEIKNKDGSHTLAGTTTRDRHPENKMHQIADRNFRTALHSKAMERIYAGTKAYLI